MSSDDDPPEPESAPQITGIVLAAGRGERLRSNVPKPAYPICGRAMAAHVLHALADAGVLRAVVVIPPGEDGDVVRRAVAEDSGCVTLDFAVQQQPRGTADAVLAARDAVLAARDAVKTSHVLVVNGDLPLLTDDQVRPLLASTGADATIATTVVEEPAKMGRIVRDASGDLSKVVEWRDASEAERCIREVNVGIYLFRSDFLWPELERIVAGAAESDEAYATDAIPIAVAKHSACAVKVPVDDVRLNVETPSDAAAAEAAIRSRVLNRLLDSGVHIRDPQATWIDAQAEVEPGVTIEPGTHIRGRSVIGQGSRIGPNAIIEDTTIGENCAVESCTIRGSTLRDSVEVGPYSTIRPGCEIGSNVHIGTHAELKQARIDEEVQIGHFSYLGDAVVGARTNIGAGAITCNYDGESKHQTTIGEDAFIGCDTMLVAPLYIGDRARTGAGSVVTKDVPADGNAVGHPARLTPARRSSRETGPLP